MTIISRTKNVINKFLQVGNMRLDSLTLERNEYKRIIDLDQKGHFEKRSKQFSEYILKNDFILPFKEIYTYIDRFDTFTDGFRNDVDYTFNNDFYSSPDAEVLYTLVRKYHPKNIIEIGSGNSTKIIRQAIIDGGLNTRLTSIDPSPRCEITELTDQHYVSRVEDLPMVDLTSLINPGDFLFMDSSHEIKAGNDVLFIYLDLLPCLPKGVIVHVHDVFLPFEYPKEWVLNRRWSWNEQYLVQAILTFHQELKIIWPGYYLQKTCKEFEKYLPHARGRRAQSLWFST
jgi:hypothetical protein